MQSVLRAGTLLALGIFCAGLPARAAAPAQPAAQDVQIASDVHGNLAELFVLPKQLELDPALREAAGALGSAHLARMRALLAQWAMEERKLLGTAVEPNPYVVSYSVWARVLNELALWQVDTGDAAYEAATLAAIQRAPSVCEVPENRANFEFARRVLRLQAMPPDQRQAALATERSLLERWGKPRPATAPWPSVPPQVAAAELLAQSRDGGGSSRPALPPMVAAGLLGNRLDYEALSLESRCHFQRWWLRASIGAGAAPADALAAFRYGTMLTARLRYGDGPRDKEQEKDGGKAKGSPGYPELAARFGVTGTTTVTRTFDAKGKPLQAWVSGRNLTVPGIRGVRPIAFEDAFDVLAVRYALAGSDGKDGKPGPKVFQMVWHLDPPDGNDAQAGQHAKGASQ